ncbi:unnamed protein product [Clonostachys rhizophaga]|uniref:NACHT domain-containing protein n=1 Tax=Clonostachys rhizophaga TaxID=160324 RepID=A0A9N9V5F5_9HYPO|nr:unnamed protein product [Clonostachys rhizophaga]
MTPGSVDDSNSTTNDFLSLFGAARDKFLDSLSPEDKNLYSPCASSDDFVKAIDKLKTAAGRTSTKAAKGLKCLYTLNTFFRPYFDVLSGRVETFFEKLLELLVHLRDAFPRYADVVSLCKDAGSERIRQNVLEVYLDMFEIFQAAVKVFTKSSGKIKRTPVVLGALLWKPFDIRFNSLIQKMNVHRENIEAEVRIWKLKRDDQNYTETMIWRRYISQEMKDTKEECRVLSEEQRLTALEKEADLESRKEILAILRELQAEKRRLEERRLEETAERIQKWLDSSGSAGIRESNSQLREPNTGEWILDDAQYKSWVQPKPDETKSQQSRRFGKNMLWIQGNPGSGKSVLATFLLDTLETEEDECGEKKDTRSCIIFFHFNHPETITPSSAFRSLLQQVLWQGRHDPLIVDKFLFLMTCQKENAPSLVAESPSALISFLQSCVDDQTIVVIDGVDECINHEEFIKGLLEATKASSTKVLALSRVKVEQLQRSVSPEQHLPLPKKKMESDIRLFSHRELKEFIEDGILPDCADGCLNELVDRVALGADGMFLWARLMISFIQSPAHSKDKRLSILREIDFPEGLRKMYQRIFRHIKNSGETAHRLANHLLIWLKYRATAMSTKQTRQALSNAAVWTMGDHSDDILDFEKAALIACAGLVEICPLPSNSEVINILKFSHLSVKEVLDWPNPIFESEDQAGQPLLRLIPASSSFAMNLRLATQCLQQLLYHTPMQPLACKFGTSVSAATVGRALPFTDYAALYWMDHATGSRFELDPESPGPPTTLSSSFLDAFRVFSVELRTFLESPKALSVWLETYYTTQVGTSPSGTKLRSWASWLSDLSQKGLLNVDSQLLGLIFEFRSDLDRIIAIWDDRLRLTPHIVWDEATALNFSAGSLFFFSGGVRVVSRAPQRPSIAGLNERPYISISATSSDSSLLGVLAMWGLKCQNPNSVHSWWVTYDLWPLGGNGQRIANVVANMETCEAYAYSIWLGVVLSISPDAMAFSVRNTIWRLLPDDSCKAQGLSTHVWATPVHYESCSLGDRRTLEGGTYRISFSPTAKYAILSEVWIDSEPILTKTAYELPDPSSL